MNLFYEDEENDDILNNPELQQYLQSKAQGPEGDLIVPPANRVDNGPSRAKINFMPSSPIQNKRAPKDNFAGIKEQNAMQKLIAGIGEASDSINRAYSPVKSDPSFWRGMSDDADQMYAQDMAAEKARLAAASKQDPAEMEMMKAQLRGYFEGNKADRASEERRLDREAAQKRAETVAAGMRQRTAASADRVENEKVDNQTKELATKIAPAQSIMEEVKSLEDALGFNLDDYDIKTNTVRGMEDKGQVDTPGVSIPLLGRVSGYNSRAKDIEAAMDRIKNINIKEFAGSAVAKNEMERIQSGFKAGKYATEADRIDAMREFKQAMLSGMKNLEAGYKPKAKERYREQGGGTYEDYSAPRKVAPQSDVFKGGSKSQPAKAAEKSIDDMTEAELDDYIARGGK